jgi:hypothetical protein
MSRGSAVGIATGYGLDDLSFFLVEGPNLFAICNNTFTNGGKGEGCLVEEYSVAPLS